MADSYAIRTVDCTNQAGQDAKIIVTRRGRTIAIQLGEAVAVLDPVQAEALDLTLHDQISAVSRQAQEAGA
ncbi:hypothetical protein GCM10011581_12440 [Saccharopolyspora subtropica]|uniref:Uncharacterized protein n=1 Tax=Saccharopolyspora thermophila TaxID=89367 RepID=A0A917JPJ0_9PSEU|nr:hypothetical protein [Saccharopolyspora subtropica]GGI76859.1 hypothetical protein GCM10011581_12440 [Saccharopolyspora subtropica]